MKLLGARSSEFSANRYAKNSVSSRKRMFNLYSKILYKRFTFGFYVIFFFCVLIGFIYRALYPPTLASLLIFLFSSYYSCIEKLSNTYARIYRIEIYMYT